IHWTAPSRGDERREADLGVTEAGVDGRLGDANVSAAPRTETGPVGRAGLTGLRISGTDGAPKAREGRWESLYGRSRGSLSGHAGGRRSGTMSNRGDTATRPDYGITPDGHRLPTRTGLGAVRLQVS